MNLELSSNPTTLPAGTAPMPWVPALDSIAPLAIMDWRIDLQGAEPMGPADEGPDGTRECLWAIQGGEVVGAGGLRGTIVPGPSILSLRRPDGVRKLTGTLRMLLADGSSVITELHALGEGASQRAILRCTVNRGPFAWLSMGMLVAVVREGPVDSPEQHQCIWLRVYAMEGGIQPGVLVGYQPLSDFPVLPPLRTEHVLNIVGTCSAPQPAGLSPHAPDGVRTEIWPITGGVVTSHDGKLAGRVMAGGGDYPYLRPDGIEWVEALYRFKTDDGYNVVIHNKGIYREGASRLHPEFIVNRGPHDWLNRSLFVATLTFPVPPEVAQASHADDNDRLIQVHRVD